MQEEIQGSVDWAKAFNPLLAKYRDRKHPLEYKNVYQLLVMVVLSAQDSDANINRIAPSLFDRFPDMASLSKANFDEILPFVQKIRGHRKKISWLQDIASVVQTDKKIPRDMKSLVALKGIGRKSANVIMREVGAKPEGIMCDLHVVRVAPRLGITSSSDPVKIERDLMEALPEKMWHDAGMAISYLGRETCRPKNPKHLECVMNRVCAYCIKNCGSVNDVKTARSPKASRN